MDKTIIAFILGSIAFIVGIVYLMGLPTQSVKYYEKSNIVCRAWNDEWSLSYKNVHCEPFK